MSKISRNRRFRMEQLEDRRLMAGDVLAMVNSEGTLVLLEAGNSVGGPQSVWVQPAGNGTVKLVGITSPANVTGSIIRDASGRNLGDPTFTGVKNIQINFGDGSDEVRVGTSTPNVIPFGAVTINTEGAAGSVKDNDLVFVQNLLVSKQLDIRTGVGADNVQVKNSEVRLNGAPNIFTLISGPENAPGETDQDSVLLDGVKAQGNVSISTGASADSLTIKRSDFNFVSGTTVFSTTVKTGAGADIVKIGSDDNEFAAVAIRGPLMLDLGSSSQNDRDTLRVRDLDVFQDFTLSLGGGDDELAMERATVRKNLLVTAMGGNDNVAMTQVNVFETFFAEMGDGDDTLSLTGVRARKIEADGAAGANDRLFTFDMTNVAITKTGFEEINGSRLPLKKSPIVGGPVSK